MVLQASLDVLEPCVRRVRYNKEIRTLRKGELRDRAR
jgi:hypothetical protein